MLTVAENSCHMAAVACLCYPASFHLCCSVELLGQSCVMLMLGMQWSARLYVAAV